MIVNRKSEGSDTPLQDAKNQTRHADTSLSDNCPTGDSSPAATEQNVSLLDGTRAMLAMAVEGAFDLRLGRVRSIHLENFDKLVADQTRTLDEISAGESRADLKLLVLRAQEALNGFSKAVQREIVETVHPGVTPEDFHARLEVVQTRAVAAGAALGSIDLARQRLRLLPVPLTSLPPVE